MKYNRVFTCTIFTILSLTATVGLAQITAVVSSPLGAANKALPEVRMVYLIPSDRVYHGDYATSMRSEEHTSELQSQSNLVCRLLLEKKKVPQLGCHGRADRLQGKSEVNLSLHRSKNDDVTAVRYERSNTRHTYRVETVCSLRHCEV